ncbi:hypothetical protein [Enterobacter sp.]|uniref:hypothetical protein n=1 Tax=Enterobacter sp. TaxID=42895 RepID=UPI00296FF9C0|nr:hypothetical protein [Enterobacter sp.]
MVEQRNYEEYQLGLILAEYALKGYRPVMQDRFSNIMMFDAIVIDSEERHCIIIELINSSRVHGIEQEKIKRFKDMAQDPHLRSKLRIPEQAEISVDFRYIDNNSLRNDRNAIIQREYGPHTLEKLLANKLPPSAPDNNKSWEKQFLHDWSLIARTIRSAAIWIEYSAERVQGQSVLELYNLLLSLQVLIPTEQLAPDYDEFHDAFNFPDLFELHDKVLNVIEGDVVSQNDVRTLRFHLTSIRKQLKNAI